MKAFGGEAVPRAAKPGGEDDVGGQHEEGDPEGDGAGEGGADVAEGGEVDEAVAEAEVGQQREAREEHEGAHHGLRLEVALDVLDEAVGEDGRDEELHVEGGRAADLGVLLEEQQNGLREVPEHGDEDREYEGRHARGLQVYPHRAEQLRSVPLPA